MRKDTHCKTGVLIFWRSISTKNHAISACFSCAFSPIAKPACWFFDAQFSTKNHQKSLISIEKLMDPKAKCRLGYLNSREWVCTENLKLLSKQTRNQNKHFWYVPLNIFGPKTILFFRFSNSMISRSLSIFAEKRSKQWCIFFPDLLGAGAGLGWAGLGLA